MFLILTFISFVIEIWPSREGECEEFVFCNVKALCVTEVYRRLSIMH